MSDPRVKAGVLLAMAGEGGARPDPVRGRALPLLNPGFADMTTPALVVAGDQDQSPLTIRGPDWFTDPYFLSPGGKSLLTLFGAEHLLGGISGYHVTETTDENPERVALIQRLYRPTSAARSTRRLQLAGARAALTAAQPPRPDQSR